MYVNATLTSPQLPPPTLCTQVHSLCQHLFFFLIYFLNFWLHWVFVTMCGLLIAVASLAAEQRL